MSVCPFCNAIYGQEPVHTNDGLYYYCTPCNSQYRAREEEVATPTQPHHLLIEDEKEASE